MSDRQVHDVLMYRQSSVNAGAFSPASSRGHVSSSGGFMKWKSGSKRMQDAGREVFTRLSSELRKALVDVSEHAAQGLRRRPSGDARKHPMLCSVSPGRRDQSTAGSGESLRRSHAASPERIPVNRYTCLPEACTALSILYSLGRAHVSECCLPAGSRMSEVMQRKRFCKTGDVGSNIEG